MDRRAGQPSGFGPISVSWRYLVPNCFTTFSVILALVSVALSYEQELEWAAWCILWCVLLDKADGTAARLLNATSPFGTELDSMADLLAFGLAPAALVYSASLSMWNVSPGQLYWWSLWIAGGWYVLSAAIRLARFNIDDSSRARRHFVGVPTTLCGVIVPGAVLVGMKHGLSEQVLRFMPATLGALGLGMVSQLPVPKVVARRSKVFNAFQAINAVAVYACAILTVYPEYLFGLAICYLVLGSLHSLLRPPSTSPSRGDRFVATKRGDA